ncbi:MAG: GMC oxidoreductase [Janthinobacterium lividum]
MIITDNFAQLDKNLTADICLIGSGPAAISLALSLNNTGLDVLMLAGGGWTESVASQDLYRGSVWPAGSHEPLEENRRRQFGGTSAAWGGRCIPFEPLDFKRRDWVPDSGWPFTYDELLPYYQRAAELCQIGDFEFDARQAFAGNPTEIVTGLDSAELVSYPLERWSPPVHFGKEYRAALEASPNIRVLFDAHAIALQPALGADEVSHVDVDVRGFRLQVRARRFVLATGGIENARLLLTSTSERYPAGLGNQHDNVGRYYMVHLSGTYTDVKLHDKSQLWGGFERDANGVYCRRRWWFSEPAQAAHKLFNTIFFLYHANTDNGHRDVLFSTRFVAKAVLSIVGQRSVNQMIQHAKQVLPAAREHFVNILKNGLLEIPDLIRLGFKRMAKRRLPFLLPSQRNAYWGLYFQAEQAPNRESRVGLSPTEKDAFGMPRAEVRLAFIDADVNSVVEAHRLFVKQFRANNLGEITYDETQLRQYLGRRVAAYNSTAHHIGTTRMATDPRVGVVDEHAKVHGVNNLYVAGSSIFPTGGHANPTLTLVAHALLLAEHLKQA